MDSRPPVPHRPPVPTRRRLISGGAWAVPAVLLAAPAPALAASPGPCPVLAFDTTAERAAWTVKSPATGSVTTGSGDTQYQSLATAGQTLTYWKVQANSTYSDVASPNSTVTTTTTMEVRAGTTYTFHIYVRANNGNWSVSGSRGAGAKIYVGGQELWAAQTRHLDAADFPTVLNLGNPIAESPVNEYTFTWAAPSTGTVEYVIEHTIVPHGGTTSNDDIAITAPEITCSL